MGELEGTYRVLQTPGARLGAERSTGISTLEPGQNLNTALSYSPAKNNNQNLCSSILLLDGTELPVEIGVCYGMVLKRINLKYSLPRCISIISSLRLLT